MTATEPKAAHARHHGHEPPSAGGATDPVCGMSVDPATARHRAGYAGREYFFCSARCRERFVAEPGRFVGDKPAPPAAAGKHDVDLPDASRDRARPAPGNCPICGMALEPMTPAGRRGEQPRAGRHDAAVLGRRRAVGAAAGHGDGRAYRPGLAFGADRRASRSGCSSRSRRRSCCGAAGRSSGAAGGRSSTAT